MYLHCAMPDTASVFTLSTCNVCIRSSTVMLIIFLFRFSMSVIYFVFVQITLSLQLGFYLILIRQHRSIVMLFLGPFQCRIYSPLLLMTFTHTYLVYCFTWLFAAAVKIQHHFILYVSQLSLPIFCVLPLQRTFFLFVFLPLGQRVIVIIMSVC